MLGGIGGRRRRGQQRMRWLDDITDSMDVSLSDIHSQDPRYSLPREPGIDPEAPNNSNPILVHSSPGSAEATCSLSAGEADKEPLAAT